jgi:flagellin-like hook-associated protein FlgL
MIGLIEDARGAVGEAGTLLDEAADLAVDKGRTNIARELRKLRDELDDISNRIEQQRTALR